MLTKHDSHECKEYKENLPSFMILADHHFKNLQNKQEKTTDDEVLENIEDMIVNTNNKKPG